MEGESGPKLMVRLQRNLTEGTLLLVLAAVGVGAATGLAAVLFIKLIAWIEATVFGGAESLAGWLGDAAFVFIPLLGALLVGPVVAFWAAEAKGHGVPEVMQALILRGGRMRPRVVLAKILASAVCIGTGGSAGREGPIIQVGSALGSTTGQLLRLSNERIKNLVACGAAAGIAATFNAPIAGVAFASEVLLTELQVGMFGNVAIAAVSASIISRIYLGSSPAFDVPSYAMHSPREILLYVVLGLLAALVGVLFIRLLNAAETTFDRWRAPLALKPAVGGLLLGLLGFGYLQLGAVLAPNAPEFQQNMELLGRMPHLFGAGFSFIERVLQGREGFILLLLLVFAKPLATSLTLGSGNSGGVFAPSLFTGAMLGGAFGHAANALFPTTATDVGAYALVGMAAVFAAAAHAPFTSMLIVFEMSGDYHLILPLMAAGMVASVFSRWLHPESIYTLKLSKKGIRFETGRDLDVMQGVRVEEVMVKAPLKVHKDQPVSELFAAFQETNLNGFPVVQGELGDELYGMVTLEDMEQAVANYDNLRDLKIGDVASAPPVTAYPDEPVWSAIRKMTPRDFARLPVVARDKPGRLVGLISRSEILRAYEVGLMRKQHADLVRERMSLRRMDDIEFKEFRIGPGSPAVGKCVAELHLPHGVNFVAVQRQDGRIYIPHGGTRILAGDLATLLVRQTVAAEVVEIFGLAGEKRSPDAPSGLR